jgi:hypothetical protein
LKPTTKCFLRFLSVVKVHLLGAENLVILMAFTSHQHQISGISLAIVWAIATPRSDSTTRSTPSGMPCSTSSRMRWGSSVRGLSEVTTTRSAKRAAIAAI